MNVEERVRLFCETWERRKAGELSAPDMKITCQSCGVQVMQGEPVAFTTRGFVCKGCLDKGDCNHE